MNPIPTPPPSGEPRTTEFDETIAKLTASRGALYGHPKDNFARIARLTAETTSCHHPEIRVALDMILTKVARLVETPAHMDSVLDIAGYARTITMILDKEAESSPPPTGARSAEGEAKHPR